MDISELVNTDDEDVTEERPNPPSQTEDKPGTKRFNNKESEPSLPSFEDVVAPKPWSLELQLKASNDKDATLEYSLTQHTSTPQHNTTDPQHGLCHTIKSSNVEFAPQHNNQHHSGYSHTPTERTAPEHTIHATLQHHKFNNLRHTPPLPLHCHNTQPPNNTLLQNRLPRHNLLVQRDNEAPTDPPQQQPPQTLPQQQQQAIHATSAATWSDPTATTTPTRGRDPTTPDANNTKHQPEPQAAAAEGGKGKLHKHQCPFKPCYKSFPTASELTSHTRTHTGERPFPCQWPGCGKAFTQSGGLLRHQKTHAGTMTHKCNECESRFSDAKLLRRHKSIHAQDRPFPCRHNCGKSFITAYHMVRHERTHTGDKPFKCTHPNCHRAFAQSNGLQRHLRTHEIQSQEDKTHGMRFRLGCESCGAPRPCPCANLVATAEPSE